MKTNEYLALVAMEECAEIQQALSKGMRFGFQDTHPARANETNAEEVLTEYYQLTAMMEALQQEGLLETFSASKIASIKRNKLAKVEHYMAYSKDQGALE